jgi:hypothetical protein
MSGSLQSLPSFVRDAFKIGAAVPFVPENVVLGSYTFVPWVRTGLAAALTPPAAGAVRATVSVSMDVEDADGGREPVSQTLILRGPGDVVGLDGAQVIRQVPASGTPDAEESFLAHVEFDRPELPWLFSPFAPDAADRIQPWIALVVCEVGEAELLPGAPGHPQVLHTTLGQLQSLDDAWAFAHAQVVGPRAAAAGTASVADRLTDEHAPANLSRLLCPRKLDPDRAYYACVVPTFDCGVRAGMALDGGTLEPAWRRDPGGHDAATPILLPVYYSWRFSTAPAGDFEQLAERLHGVAAPWNVGRRIVDASHPRGGIPDLPDGAAGERQVLRCALVSPAPVPPDQPAEGVDWDADQREALRAAVDAGNAPDPNLPRVGPRLYARFQRGTPSMEKAFHDAAGPDADWFSQLNTSPMRRVVAGLGTRVVQKDQEQLMQAAWAQVGDIERANGFLTRLQFGRYVGEALTRKNLAVLPLGQLTQLLRGVHGKIRQGATPLTVYGVMGGSWVPPAAVTGAFRRATRLRGPLGRFMSDAARSTLRDVIAPRGSFRDLRRAYLEPQGVRTLSPSAIQAFPAELVAAKLGVPPAEAAQALADRLAARPPSLADNVLSPLAGWRVPGGTLDLGTIAAKQLTETVNRAMPAHSALDPARAEALASMLVGIANSNIPEVSPGAGQIIGRLDRELPLAPVGRGGVDTGLIGLGHPPVRTISPQVTAPRTATRSMTRSAAVAETAVRQPPGPAAALEPRTRFETVGSRAITERLSTTRAVPMTEFARSLSEMALGTGILDLPRTPERAAPAIDRKGLLAAVDPGVTATRYARARIGPLPSWLPADWLDNLRVEPIMAAPHFDRPMYEALDAYDRDWLVPGLGSIPFTDFVTLLNTNPEFTAAFLVGLSDEMGRELLWRGYPTDQRGTYFRRFWDEYNDELANDIHQFARTALMNQVKNGGGAQGHIVLVVRGALVKRYPDAMMMALLADDHPDDQGRPIFSVQPAEYLFHAHLAPDVILVGFQLTEARVRNEPWWFVIAEHPTAPRFGLDLFDPRNPRAPGLSLQRDSLDWNDLAGAAGALDLGRFLSPRGRSVAVRSSDASDPPSVDWPGNAAVVAYTLLQSPLRAAFQGSSLIAPAHA